MKKFWGLVEGFYWREDDAVDQVYGEFSHKDRRKLIRFLREKELNTYIYDPKVLRGDNYERCYSTKLIGPWWQWYATLRTARKYNVQFIWGFAPGRSEIWQHQSDRLLKVLRRLHLLGVNDIALLFDDVPGGATQDEMREQAGLVELIRSRSKTRIVAFCPGLYSGDPNNLLKNLAVLDNNIPADIPFLLTGPAIWCHSIDDRDLPEFSSGRGIILWDNWAACDTSEERKQNLTPPLNRSAAMIRRLTGYVLNPFFPANRTPPLISWLSKIRENKSSLSNSQINVCIADVSRDWASFTGECENKLKEVLVKKVDLSGQKNQTS